MKKLLFLLCGLLLSILGHGQTLHQAEYFFDTDPGIGQGVPIAFSPTDSLSLDSLLVSSQGLTFGYHYLYVRVQKSDGVWGHTNRKRVFVYDFLPKATASPPLIGGEYFFDKDSLGPGGGVPFSFGAADSITLDLLANTPNLDTGQHTLFVRVKDASGVWSLSVKDDFQICSNYDPIPNFVWDQSGRTFFFWDSSRHATQLHWDFGDGSVDTTVNPTHSYSSPGLYEVIQTSQNQCGTNTISKSILIEGISRYEPAYYANDGFFPMQIEGLGFTGGFSIKLEKAGSPAITPESMVIRSSESLQANFRVSEVDTGYYNLIFLNPNGPNDTIKNGFEFRGNGQYELDYSVSGPNPILRNQPTLHQITVANSGDRTAYAIPIFVRTIGEGVFAEVLNKFFDTDSIPQSILDSIPPAHFYPDFDSLENDSVNIGAFIIPYLLPGKEYTLNIRLTSSIGSNYVFNLEVIMGNPLIEKSELINLGLETLCDAYLPPIWDCALAATAFVPGAACAVGLTSLGCGIARVIDSGAEDPGLIDFVGAGAGTALACSPAGLISSARDAFKFGRKLAGYAWRGQVGISSCDWDDFFPKRKKKRLIKVVNSSDPNLKAGLLGFGPDNYLPQTTYFPYQVFFENVDSATAPANEVVIIDTFDTSVFDIHSFQFKGFGLYDSIYQFQAGKDSFVVELDLSPVKPILLRVSGQLDKGNGFATWRFLSLDTLRRAENQVVADAFLNPNVAPPEGEGFVLFSINTIAGLPHDTELNNRAAIIFDYNDPILTDWHTNTLDLLSPTSSVAPLPKNIPANGLLNDSMLIVNWSGSDPGSGILYYDVYLSIGNDTTFTKWQSLTTELFDTLAVNSGESYRFYSIAYDGVGNIEEKKDSLDVETMIVPSTSVEEKYMANPVRIYPNPSTGVVHLEASNFHQASLEGKIYSLIGQEMAYFKFQPNSQSIKETIDISAFPAGLYFFHFYDDRGELSLIEKVFKE